MGTKNIVADCIYLLKMSGCQKVSSGVFFDICLFLNGDGSGDGNGFLLEAALVGKCFFFRLCLINQAFRWKHQKRNRIIDTELYD